MHPLATDREAAHPVESASECLQALLEALVSLAKSAVPVYKLQLSTIVVRCIIDGSIMVRIVSVNPGNEQIINWVHASLCVKLTSFRFS